jgi:hypothetical protein
MMMKRVVVLAVTGLAMVAARPAQAIPAFARRYQVECHFCHDGYPKLNRMGERFKERGFRMEKEDAFELDKWARTVPVAVRGTYTHYFIENFDDSDTGFIKGISAGSLGRHVSYWVDDGLLITKDETTHSKPDNAWARIEVVQGGKLYLKGGRLEMDLPFTQARTPHLFPYDVYFANTGSERDTIGDFQDGVEVGGYVPQQDLHWSVAVVNGHDAPGAEDVNDRTERFDANVFLRLSKRINRHRVGGFAYIGRNVLAQSATIAADDSLLRLGADVNLWYRRLNVYGVGMYGRNSNSILSARSPSGTHQSLSYGGGFLQMDWHARDILVLTLRGNLVSRPPAGTALDNVTFASLFPGVQVFVLQRVKLAFEYGFNNRDLGDIGAVQVGLAF